MMRIVYPPLLLGIALGLSGILRADLPAGHEGEVTSVPFVAVPEQRPREAPAPVPPGEIETSGAQPLFTETEGRPESRFSVNASGAIGFPKMQAVNDYVDWINTSFSASIDECNRYTQYGLGVEYRFADTWSTGLAYRSIEAKTDGRLFFGGLWDQFSIDLDAKGAEIYAKKTWPALIGPLDVSALAGVAYYTSSYREQEDTYIATGDDSRLGYRVGVELAYPVTKDFHIFAEASYLMLEFDNYRCGGAVVRFVSPGAPPAKADFSGFQALVGVAWSF